MTYQDKLDMIKTFRLGSVIESNVRLRLIIQYLVEMNNGSTKEELSERPEFDQIERYLELEDISIEQAD